MNINFFIEDLKYKGNITIGKMIEIGQHISQFDLSSDYEELDENLKYFGGLDRYFAEKIKHYQFITLGQKGVSARGFELSYKSSKKSYCIKMFLPCSIDDFKIVFDYIKKLCAYLDTNKVIIKKDEEYTADNIEEYPYMQQIMSSLKQTMRAFKKQKEPDTIEFSGIIREVSFDEKMFTEIMASENPVEKFSTIFTDIQKIDAYTPRQKFHRGKYIGVYTLTETVRTILPFKPAVNSQYKYMANDDDIEYWDLNLVVIEGDPADIKSYRVFGSIRYSKFIEKLPKDKYKFIDADYILVEGLSRAEIEKLLD